ncbi:serine/threonine protein kinase [Pendulispora brunnea]|uniref:Serine/threonine protein kinase n=1 Tax=Pendulispora brunnea TaxID=2905690 RepID=A0ABZ2KQK1_9BACT
MSRHSAEVPIEMAQGPSSARSSLVVPSAPGTAGRYRLIFELGHGGMSDVVLAVIQGPGNFNKLQVLKFLRASLAEEADFCAMFLEEARLSARINHPNVAQTNEVGFDGSRYFMAMEYLEGHSLDDVLRRIPADKRPLNLVLRAIADACVGLHFAHELKDFDGTPLNVVHRDVSPQNIFLTYEGTTKLLDFGIAKASDSKSRTEVGIIKGKLAYMSPEQAMSGQLDRRADIFSVGAILWRVVTGKRLWAGTSEVAALHALAGRDIPPPLPQRGIPPELVRICQKAMAADPAARYPTAIALHAELERVIASLGGATSAGVADMVSKAFAERRREVKATIEARLSASPSMTGITHVAQLPRLEPSTATGTVEVDAIPLPPSVPARPSRTNWGLAGAGAAIAVGIVAAALIARAPSAGAPEVAASASAAPVLATAPMTELTFDVSPTNAQVFVDDVLLLGRPPRGTFPQDGREHKIRAESPGFSAKTSDVKFGASSVHVEVTLEKERRAAAPAPPTPAAQARPQAARARVAPVPVAAPISPAPPPPPASPSPPPPPSPRVVEPSGPTHALDKDDPWKK